MISVAGGINKPQNSKPDPRLSDPVNTWELHKKAALDGDLALLEKTLTRPDHDLIETFKHLDPEKTTAFGPGNEID